MSTGAGLVEFPLSPTSCLKIQKGDITQWSVDGSSDAIVTLSFSPSLSLFLYSEFAVDVIVFY